MRVTVEYFGPAREAAGVAVEEVVLDGPCSAGELVVRVARARGGRLAALILAGDRLAPSILLAVNDRQAAGPEPEPLRGGDVVTVIPPVSGGAAEC